ncbi:arginine/ornithine antiporter arcD [Vibrio ishigakensis]|uniref:Arginine/ornithine antiporter arcD n=1 Tax=Vibrio ishigakensis TaxID=1481914 RepID=A0A0B8QFF6_9VIBR|nr:arginine/ornithine antiporter arcD [Vibrio ishigakensis]
MGAADVVPGVSGGTIAFITGVYDTLLESIRRINPSLIGILKDKGIKGAFEHINGLFLVTLFGGVLTSILTLAKLISWLLVTHPIPLWSFFFGLILVSVWLILRQIESFNASKWAFLLVGIGFAYMITVINPLQLEPTGINVVLAGAIAICAMILPGISGSFILLLIGMYAPVLAAVKGFQIDILALFLVGCVGGLLSFSHLLSWLLKRFRDFTLMFLVGLMIGTLPKIWPWKQTLTWRTNSSGEQVPLIQENLMPHTFESIFNTSSQLPIAIVMMLAAIGMVLALEKIADK